MFATSTMTSNYKSSSVNLCYSDLDPECDSLLKRAVTKRGWQADLKHCILNKDLYLDTKGRPVSGSERSMVWLTNCWKRMPQVKMTCKNMCAFKSTLIIICSL